MLSLQKYTFLPIYNYSTVTNLHKPHKKGPAEAGPFLSFVIHDLFYHPSQSPPSASKFEEFKQIRDDGGRF